MVMNRIRSQIIAAAFALTQSSVVWAGPIEDETIAAFDSFCVANISHPEKFPDLMRAIGVEPLSSDKAAPFLGGQSGTVWPFVNRPTKMVLTLTTKGVCGLFGYDADPQEATRLFEAKFRNKKLNSETIGSELEEVFAVSQADQKGGQDIHVLVFVKTSTLASIPGITITAMPESLMQEGGISFKDWP